MRKIEGSVKKRKKNTAKGVQENPFYDSYFILRGSRHRRPPSLSSSFFLLLPPSSSFFPFLYFVSPDIFNEERAKNSLPPNFTDQPLVAPFSFSSFHLFFPQRRFYFVFWIIPSRFSFSSSLKSTLRSNLKFLFLTSNPSNAKESDEKASKSIGSLVSENLPRDSVVLHVIVFPIQTAIVRQSFQRVRPIHFQRYLRNIKNLYRNTEKRYS